MATTYATLEYLQKLPLYDHEKPYWCFLPPSPSFNPDIQRVDNLEFESRSHVPVTSIRSLPTPPTISTSGFQVFTHTSKFQSFDKGEDVEAYKIETENFLMGETGLGAVYAKTYDTVLRKNVRFERDRLDLADPLHTEGPARGVHNDITYESGPTVINRYMSDKEKATFMRPGYRFRIVNTWRTLVPCLEDRPLALCDSRSVDPEDLIPADRVIPGKAGEVYYLTYNPDHKWYWLDKQTPSEPFVFVMYDTKDGPHARFCPHVSFDDPKAPPNATPRESIETRSIVVTKE